MTGVDELDARLAALSLRIDSSIDATRRWVLRPAEIGGPDPDPAPTLDAKQRDEQVSQLEGALASAQSSTTLQVQRCMSLEDQLAVFKRQLAQAKAVTAEARAEATQARQTLDDRRGSGSGSGSGATGGISAAFQAKLLEIEQLTRERDTLRRSTDEWRTRARTQKRSLQELGEKHDRAQAQLLDLRARDESARGRLAELERMVSEQRRDLDLATRRTEHLRERLGSSTR